MTPAQLRTAPDRGGPNHVLDVKKILAGISEVRLAYQPVVDLDRGVVVGYEALARFGNGHRVPGPWFAAAEEAGRLADLEALIVTQVLEARASAPRDAFLAVNVSPRLLLGGAVWSTIAE